MTKMNSGHRINGRFSGGRDGRGRFAKGNPGKQPGSNSNVRTAIKDFVGSKIKDLPKWFAGLESDSERISAFIKLLTYVIPRLSHIEYEGDQVAPTDEPNAKPFILDYSKLSDSTLKELQALLKNQQTEN